MGQYIPMIGKAFWGKLSADQQKMMVDLWAQNIADYRKNAAASQANARKVLETNGVKFHDPSADEAGATRKAMHGRRRFADQRRQAVAGSRRTGEGIGRIGVIAFAS